MCPSVQLLCAIILCGIVLVEGDTFCNNREGVFCEGEKISKRCRCDYQERCDHNSWNSHSSSSSGSHNSFFDECCCDNYNHCRTKSSCSFDEDRDFSGRKCKSNKSCRTVKECDAVYSEACENKCKPSNGKCADDDEVCGELWAGASSSFCHAPDGKNLPQSYKSWKNIMENGDTMCGGVNGANCYQLGAKEDADWFDKILETFAVKNMDCAPINSTVSTDTCFEGSVPSYVSPTEFFKINEKRTFSAPNGPDPNYQVELNPSTCESVWDTFSCMRNIPECSNDAMATTQCETTCDTVSKCFDAYLLFCLKESDGTSNCTDFDWNTTVDGAKCNPGFSCQGIQTDTVIFAKDARNCAAGAERCEERPYMLQGGYCSEGDQLLNLCVQNQPAPPAQQSARGSPASTLSASWALPLCSLLASALLLSAVVVG